MNIVGKKVTLRAIEESDLVYLHKWSNDPEIWELLGGWSFPKSFDSLKFWFSNIKNDKLSQKWAITTEELGLIGTTNLVDIDWKNRNAFHGIMIGDKNTRGKGYGLDTLMTVMKYSFEELNLNRLDTTIIEYNKPSLNLYKNKCGWKEEGTQKKWYFRKNNYWDRLMLGILQEDYFNLVKENGYWL
ncbi:MAG: GNAT family protein [Candidatus Sericytochromatia bacterium]